MPKAIRAIAVPTPLAIGRVNTYLLEGAPLTLVDAGPVTDEAYGAIRDGLRAAGHGIADLERIVITHAHVDHCGLAARLHAESGALVLADPRALRDLHDWPTTWRERTALVERAATAGDVPESVWTRFVDGTREQVTLGSSLPEDAGTALADGEEVLLGASTQSTAAGGSWQVLRTPGHAADHLALFRREDGTLLAGDLLLRQLPTAPMLEPKRADGSRPETLRELIASWRHVGRLPAERVLPGHGPPIRAHRVLLARRLAATREGLRATRQAVRGGADTLWTIASATELSRAAGMLAITLGTVVARLDWLAQRGWVRRRVVDGTLRFRASEPARPTRRG